MIRSALIALTASALLLLTGCSSHCRGDSCDRPVSSAKSLVIWWPPHMRVETGAEAKRPDHQVVSLDR